VCRSGLGLTAVAFSRGFPAASRAEVRDLFGMVGAVLKIPEKRFDAFTVTFSSSHGYHALAALISAAEKIGLDRKSARVAAGSRAGGWDCGMARRQIFSRRVAARSSDAGWDGRRSDGCDEPRRLPASDGARAASGDEAGREKMPEVNRNLKADPRPDEFISRSTRLGRAAIAAWPAADPSA